MQTKQLLTDESTATPRCLHAVDLKDPMAVVGTVFRGTSMNVCCLGISVVLVGFTPGVRLPFLAVQAAQLMSETNWWRPRATPLDIMAAM
ncbi:unnamed protein product [Sphagnum troendelagicum]|uniref:Uncharacterized protein n=1 Tax=Sphagnum troendelagicum TaxID=128251 RepID=A0ABP0V4C5_9BRYO